MLHLAASSALPPDEIMRLFLAMGVLLGLARVMGEWSRRLGQPTIIGELLAGVVLGKTVLLQIAPGAFNYLFPDPDVADPASSAIVMRGVVLLSACFLLLVAGLEVDLNSVWRQGKSTLWVATMSMIPPFLVGMVLAFAMPGALDIGEVFADPAPFSADITAFAVFIGIALAITALPVIAKILMDLDLLKSDLGMLIMSAAMLIDIVGWVGFAVVKALMPALDAGEPAASRGSGETLALLGWTILFIVGMLTIGRLWFRKLVPYLQARWTWPGGVIGLVLIISLFCAAVTEWIGIHSIFGAFIAGVAIGDSRHLRGRTRETIHQFITSIFAPIFFASIAIRINFIDSFDPLIVGLIFALAMVGKVVGSFVGARIAGLDRGESWATGFGMAAQGSMGVILGELAYNAGLIGPKMLVALIVTAIVTSIVSGPAIQRLLRPKRATHLGEYLKEKQYIPQLDAIDVRGALLKMATVASRVCGIPANDIFEAVWAREQIIHTGLGDGMAVPHARLKELDKPLVIMARSERGIDFDAADGKPANLICLLLTPQRDDHAQTELLSMFARAFHDAASRQAALEARTFNEFIAALRLPGEDAEEAEPAGA